MIIKTMEIKSDSVGNTSVDIWLTCETIHDIDNAIAWLRLAKSVMEKWVEIQGKDEA